MIEKKPAMWPIAVCSRLLRKSVSCPHSCSTANHCTSASANISCPKSQIHAESRDDNHSEAAVRPEQHVMSSAPAAFDGLRCRSWAAVGRDGERCSSEQCIEAPRRDG